MTRSDALELLFALDEIADSVRGLLAAPTADVGPAARLERSEELDRAFAELAAGLDEVRRR